MRCVLCEQGVTPNGHSCSQIEIYTSNLIPMPMKVKEAGTGIYNVNKQMHWQ